MNLVSCLTSAYLPRKLLLFITESSSSLSPANKLWLFPIEGEFINPLCSALGLILGDGPGETLYNGDWKTAFCAAGFVGLRI